MTTQPHRLVVGRLATHCDALAPASRAARIRSVLDVAWRERLPAALARAAEPVLDGVDGVIRIRRVDCRLDLGVEVDPAIVASRLAELISRALRLPGDEPERIRVWPDHESFLADYLLMRLGVRPQPPWPYEELDALEHLPAERAAAELILARPAVLAALARLASEVGGAERAVTAWPRRAQAALVAALVRRELAADERVTLPRALAAAAACAGTRAAPRTQSEEALAAVALRLALAALAGPAAALPAVAVVVAAVAILAADRGVAEPGHAAGPPPGAADQSRNGAVARAATLVAADPAAASALRQVVRTAAVADCTRDVGDAGPEQAPRPGATPAGDAGFTPFAGLALLVPSVLALRAHDALGDSGVAQAVWRALAGEDWEIVAADQGLARLFPVSPGEVDLAAPQPVPPEDLLAGRRDRVPLTERAARSARGLAGPPSGLPWTALLLADLAGRLRGFEDSSPAYLRRQFLRRPGSVGLDDRAVTVRLDPLPLGVVLHRAALAVPPPVLRHLGGRRLVLHSGDGG